MIDIDLECFLNEKDAKILVEKYGFKPEDANKLSVEFNKLKWYTESEITLDELMQILYTYEKEN